MKYRPSRRARRIAIGTAVVLVIAGFNGPALYGFASEQYHEYEINQPEYKAEKGHWQFVDIPEKYRINTIHAALLNTGKVLLVAGSGNNAKNFDSKSFRTVLWDPVDNTFKNIPTPSDLFCSGHNQLPDGKLLVAGGTQRYETLKGDVKKAGGLMFLYNESPDRAKTVKKGTRFTGKEDGKTFVAQNDVIIPRAKKKTDALGRVRVEASLARVYAEAEHKGRQYSTGSQDKYTVSGLRGAEKRNIYGIAQKMSFDKKDFQGIKDAYEFDPVAERYITVDPMHEARWYPTQVTLQDGRVLTVSGLDDIGQVVPGKNEIYNPDTKKWYYLPKTRFFPTYPGLHLIGQNRLFFSGTTAGYGPDNKGRIPGVWDLETNQFTKIPGMSDPDTLETSMSVPLPPTQSRKYMVEGGGGVGESPKTTDKTRIVDLSTDSPRFQDGPKLYDKVRYPSSVILPNDTVLTTNGSGQYRGKGDSNVLKAGIYDPKKNAFDEAAAPLVGRNYHSGGLLLPDGRVMTFGSDSLYSDKANTKPGQFDQRIEIYTPPYLNKGKKQPDLQDVGKSRKTLSLGDSVSFKSEDAAKLKKLRLVRPGSFTHVTNVEQSSVALKMRKSEDGTLRTTLPDDPSLVTPGWWMVYGIDKDGIPSKAKWLKVNVDPTAQHTTATTGDPKVNPN
ncbi:MULTISPECIES: kelch motif-containing protein [unclassified Streptomyces]|uniref:kelch motif-containing protein n=1 Tax=unclassified Streptomyces TaxID=2593676 RepID=UPI002DD7D678|nr:MULTISPECIES: kelch motif-containing protein [unclassified Streptomyces]WSA94521.1 kelch motif-containing protein [Streptomyces sp. NBC_01795]WSB78940.1 kelch motif-containing protein [Streptomyces sp. NBC_01775]WSS12858.1 kelch motif-containing protein [Streptomyces sp. NBC_01186]WSS41642.1 kelch motif-containing protein [Streptomyces sp. NBC_01187]